MMGEMAAREVLLLHGFTHTGASWEAVVGALPERYRAIAPDIRGHGGASGRGPVELAAVLEDLSGAVGERFILVGYSMGGRLALHLALAEPARTERLILIGASPGIASHNERAMRRAADERLADEIERSSIGEFARRWAQQPVLAGLPASVVDRVQKDRLRNAPEGLAEALRGLGTGALPSLWGRLRELAMPVIVVVGENDAKFRGIGCEMVAAIPNAKLIVVPGAGHAVHLEDPALVAQIITAPADRQ